MSDARRIFVRAKLRASDTFTTFGFVNVSVREYQNARPLSQLGLLWWDLVLVFVSPLVVMAFVTTLPKLVSNTPLWPVMWLMIGTMIVTMIIVFVMAQASLRWAIRERYERKGKL